ncbi:MAG: shikimate dehydrogenase [Parvularculaceae bacterium]
MTAQSDDQPRLAGVIGWPIGHSLSPLIHRIWAAREGANAYYTPVAAPPSDDDFRRVADGLRAAGFRGVNVTIPHKEHALRYADIASEAAAAVGAANMLTFKDGKAFADNSDITGFCAALSGAINSENKRRSALVLGAGGAARGVLAALQLCGVREMLIANRTKEKALAITGADARINVIDWAACNSAVGAADIIVNTTSLGMEGFGPLDLDLCAAADDAVVCDIVYKPLVTPLLATAKVRGLTTVDGLSMLMHQAVPGYLAWLGATAVVDDDLRNRLEGALGGGR